MYIVGDSLPIEQIEPGAYLLAAPAMSGKYSLLLDLLVEGIQRDEDALFVTTNEDAESVLEDVESRFDGGMNRLRLVDCVSEQQQMSGRFPAERVEYVNSPADLTGLGIGVSEQLRRFVEEGSEGTRIAFHSVSTLLMYAELETVFRFLHVLTGRVDSVDGVGFFTLDPTTHEEGTVNTVKQLFDGMIEIRGEESDREIRFVGVPETPGGWMDLE